MLFPLLLFVFTQIQCGTVEKEQLASSLGSLSLESYGVLVNYCYWIAVRIEFFPKFPFWAAGRTLPTLGCGRTWSSTLLRRPRPFPPSTRTSPSPTLQTWLKRHLWKLHLLPHLRFDWVIWFCPSEMRKKNKTKQPKLLLFWKIEERVII